MTSPQPEAVSSHPGFSRTAERAGIVHEVPTVPAELILMDRLIDLLIQKAKAGLHWPDIYERAASILGLLGLSARQGLLAGKRLRNAQRYADRQDFGAAAFELRLVRTQLA